MNDPAKEPVVKPIPTFTKGEVVTHKSGKTDHKILAIDQNGNLDLEGLAGLTPPSAVEKK